ncbi:MAG: hypothetical protein LBB23_00625 [Rickettsiales bacterium]|jgi:hypothetical protein|nr:hypothetical protein [Rickettsiales bacterium]
MNTKVNYDYQSELSKLPIAQQKVIWEWLGNLINSEIRVHKVAAFTASGFPISTEEYEMNYGNGFVIKGLDGVTKDSAAVDIICVNDKFHNAHVGSIKTEIGVGSMAKVQMGIEPMLKQCATLIEPQFQQQYKYSIKFAGIMVAGSNDEMAFNKIHDAAPKFGKEGRSAVYKGRIFIPGGEDGKDAQIIDSNWLFSRRYISAKQRAEEGALNILRNASRMDDGLKALVNAFNSCQSAIASVVASRMQKEKEAE